jgi:hypothetical protein
METIIIRNKRMLRPIACIVIALICACCSSSYSQVPNIIQYQGRITKADGATLAPGIYRFKFAITSLAGAVLWTNDGSGKTPPTNPNDVTILENGLYYVRLGESPMASMPGNLFTSNGQTQLRIWFDGTENPTQELLPAVKILPAPYALNASGTTGPVIGDTLSLGSPYNGSLQITNAAGALKVEQSVTANNVGFIRTLNSGGTNNVLISHVTGIPNAGAIGIYRDSKLGAVLTQDSIYMGQLGIYDVNGYLRGYIGSGTNTATGLPSNGTVFAVYAPNGNRVSRLSYTTSDKGSMALYHNGNQRIAIYAQDLSSSNPSQDGAGRVLVANAQGSYVIALDGADGSIVGTVKNFAVQHPNDATRQIFYSSLEGPEVGIYCRGTATLTHGRAQIMLPDHFRLICSEGSITVQLTPGDTSSKGLAVISRGTTAVEVGELFGGTGSYEFSYLIQGARKGYEAYEVVRSKIAGPIDTVDEPLRMKRSPLVQPDGRE